MKNTLHRPLALSTLAVALAVGLSACSPDQPAAFEESTAPAPASPSEDSGADAAAPSDPAQDGTGAGTEVGAEETVDEVTDQSAQEAGVDPQSLPEPIGTVTVPAQVEGDPDATMDINLHSLTRDGKTLVGIFSFQVQSDSDTDEARWIYDYLGGQGWSPHLIDTVNLNRHDVLLHTGVKAMTDYQGIKFRPGQTLFAYAAFAAPPADVDTVTVSVVDGSAALQQVPVQ